MTLSPKQRFQKTPDAAKHLELVVTDSFLNAVTAALAQMSTTLPKIENPSNAWNNACLVEGANKFIGILLNLAEVESDKPKVPDRRNLRPVE